MSKRTKGLRLNRNKQRNVWDWKHFIVAAKVAAAVLRVILEVWDRFRK